MGLLHQRVGGLGCYLDCLTSGASAARCEPEKIRSDGGVLAASPMIKSAKKGEKREKYEDSSVGVAYLSLVGSLPFILGFFLDYRKDNLIILVMRYFFPYQ